MQPAAPPPDTTPPAAAGPGAGPMAALVAAIGASAAALVLAIVPQFEGTVLKGYRDIGGVITACTGNTSDAVLGRRYTPQECTQLLASDLVKHARDLDCITHADKLKPHERAALLSFTFTVGPGKAGVKDGLCVLKDGRISSIRRYASAGNMPAACAAISEWTGVKGRDCSQAANLCSGIVRRRAAERAMCEGKFNAPAAAASGAAT